MKREFPDHPLLGVGAVVISGSSVLLVRRNQEPLKGEWSLPGGLVEIGETMAEAVVREVREETGLEVEAIEIVDVLDRITREPLPVQPLPEEPLPVQPLPSQSSPEKSGTVGRVRFHYCLVSFLCRPVGGELTAGTDVGEAMWQEWENDRPRVSIEDSTVEVINKAFALQGKSLKNSSNDFEN